MIAKTITDFAFALIETVPIIITIACKSSNKKQYSSLGDKILLSLLAEYFWNSSDTKKETSFVEKGVAWWTEEFPKQKSLAEDFQIRFVRV